jgi:hypothetical protein
MSIHIILDVLSCVGKPIFLLPGRSPIQRFQQIILNHLGVGQSVKVEEAELQATKPADSVCPQPLTAL